MTSSTPDNPLIPTNATVIIGAGVIGLACAHYLNLEGHKCIVLDSATIGSGCSQGNCGHIIPSHILPLNSPDALKTGFLSLFNKNSPFKVKPQFSLSFMTWMFQFARHSTKAKILENASYLHPILDLAFSEYEKLINDEIFSCDWQKSGLIYAFKNQSALDNFYNTDKFLQEHFNLSATPLNRDEIQEHDAAFKKGLAGGYLYENDALLRPELLLSNWTQYLKRQGIQFIENCEVLGMENKNTKVKKLKTSQGLFDVGQIVIASGAFSGVLAKKLNCTIPVIPGKGYSLTIPKPKVTPGTSIVLPEKNVAITPFKNSLRIGSIMELVGFDTALPKHRINQLRASIDDYLLSDVENVEGEEWFGWRPMTHDSLPIIVRLPNMENAFIATGHGMMGGMLAPATGRLIAEIIVEKPSRISNSPYSPARF